jgi:hypothetical protein
MLPQDRRGLTASAQAAAPGHVTRAKAALWSTLPPRLHDRLKHERHTLKRRHVARQPDYGPQRARRLADLRAQIAALSFPAAEGVSRPGIHEPPAALRDLLAHLEPATVLSLGPAEHGLLAAQQGIPTAHFAADEAECERLYALARTDALPLLAVRPLARDAHTAQGWLERRDDLESRYRADLVVACDIAPPDDRAEQASLLESCRRFTNRWLLLDPLWAEADFTGRFDAAERTSAGLLMRVGPP